MKRVEQIAAILSISLILSFADKGAKPGIGLSPGSEFPSLQLNDTTYGNFRIDAKAHDYTLVHSWATYDASSREKNVRFEHILKSFPQLNTSMVALSFDENAILFEETLRMDGLTPAWQYFEAQGEESTLYHALRVDQVFSSYLIDSEGVIVAKNFTPEQLRELLSARV